MARFWCTKEKRTKSFGRDVLPPALWITAGPFSALIVGMDSSPESDVIVLMWDHDSVFQSAEIERERRTDRQAD